MSYILNALRKSDLERQEIHAETLENRILDKPALAPKKTPLWLIILVLVNLLFLSYFLWSFTKENTDVSDVSEQKQSVKAEVEKVEPELKMASRAISRPNASIKKPKTTQQRSIAEQIRSQRQKTSSIVNTPKLTIEPKPQAVEQQPEQKTLAQPIIEPKITIPEPDFFDKKENAIPFLSALDYQFRRTVPDIDINVYVYSEKKQDSFIMIAMKKYQSGQQIDTDMTLKEIRMNSLVIEYKSRLFQIKRK